MASVLLDQTSVLEPVECSAMARPLSDPFGSERSGPGSGGNDGSTSGQVGLVAGAIAMLSGSRSQATVHADHGAASLTGEVDSQDERRLATRVTRETEGIQDVVNLSQVRG